MPLSSAARKFLIQQEAKNPVKTTTQTSTTPVAPVATLTANTSDAALAAALNPPLVTVDITTNTTTTTTQSQVGLQFGSSLSTKTVSIGESVVDTSVINTIRSKEIVFSSYHLKPLTRLYAFFDNVNVDKFIFTSTRIVLNKTVHTNRTKEFSSTNKTVKVLFAKGSTIFIKEVFTNPSLSTNTHLVVGNTFTWDSITYTITEVNQTTALETDKDGYVAGTFIIPNTAEVSFKTGTRSFLICDSFNNNAAEINTAAEFAYYASGMTQSKQATTLATRINQVTIDPILKSSSTEASPVTATTTSSSHESPLVITIDNAAPIITSYSPTRGKTDVSITTNIVINFNETIVSGTGAVTLMKPNGSIISSTSSVSGSALTILPTESLSNNTMYKVVLANGCVKDSSNNLFAGSSDYSFTTIALPYVAPVPEYTIVPNKSLAYEGEDVTFTVTATNDTTSTFYWNGTTTLEPHPELVGTVTLFNGYGTFIAKYPLEGTETNDQYYSIKLAKTADMAVVLKTSSTVTIRPLPKIPAPSASYTIESDKTSIYENQTVNFTIKTTEISDNTPLYWSASGTTITPSDFTQNILTGSVIIVNNRAYITLTAADDADTSEEVFIISLYSDSGRTTLKTSSSSISIVPLASVNPTYAIESSRNNIYEGESVKCTVTTTNVADNTTLYWSAAGTNITASDFTQDTLTGIVTVINNTGYFNLTAADDANTLNEDFIVSLWTNSGRTLNERKTRPVTILPVVVISSPVPIYILKTDKTKINELETATFSVITTNVVDNTILYWSAAGTGITASDFTLNTLIGSVSINGSIGSFSLTAADDVETLESFIISLYSDVGRTVLITTSDSVNIVPLALIPIYSITGNKSSINELESVSFSVSISNVVDATTVYWAASGYGVVASDFTQNILTGSVVVTGGGTGTISLTASDDIDGLENFTISLYSDAGMTVLKTTSASVNIVPLAVVVSTYSVAPNKTTINELESVTFTANTTNVANGTTLYWRASGTNITAADFVESILTGTVVITGGGTGTISLTASDDIDALETFTISLYTDAGMTVLKTTSASISIVPLAAVVPTYAIASNKTSVNELESVTFTANTTNVANGTTLYWSASGTNITAADFLENILTGTVVITGGGTGSFSLAASEDIDGLETFTISLYSDAGMTVLKTTSASISIVPLAVVVPTYAIASNKTTINELESVTFTANTTNVANGTTLYWSASGTGITAADFVESILTGTVVISSNTSSFSLTASDDIDGLENFTISLYSDAGMTVLKTTSASISIVPLAAVVPTYSVASNKTSVNELESVTFTANTTNVANGTTLYWSASGTNITAADFLENILTGPVVVTGNTGSFSLTASEDIDGLENFTISLYTDAGMTVLKTTSASISIVPLAAVVPTYAIASNKTTINELESVTFTANTTNVVNGTTLYWSASGTGITAADFVGNTLIGTVDVTGNTGSFSLAASDDANSLESFTISLYTDAGRTVLKTTSASISIVPLAAVVSTYSVASNKTSVNELESVTFTANTTNVANGTTLYWSASGTGITAADFVGNTLIGTVDVTGNTGSFSLTASDDANSLESFTISLYTDAGMTVLKTTSASISIVPLAVVVSTYSVASNKTTINELESVTFTANTTNVANGTTLYWSASGTNITAADFVGNTLIGTVDVTGNTGSFSLTAVDDADALESFRISLYTDAGRTVLVSTSKTVFIAPLAAVIVTYAISADNNVIFEKETVAFTVDTSNVANGTTLYWRASGTGITAADFVGNTLIGTVDVTGNTGSFSLTAVDDVDSLESFIVSLYTDAGRTLNERKTAPISIKSIVVLPTYSIKSDKTTINELESATFTVATTNVVNGKTLYWRAAGTGISSADFVEKTLTGTVSIVNNIGTFKVTAANDLDLLETFIISLYSDAGRTVLKTTSDSVNIVPLKSPEIVWEINTVTDTLYAGRPAPARFIEVTANVIAGTQVFWSIEGVNVIPSDFVGKTLTGSFTTKAINITGKTGNSLVLTASTDADLLETFVVTFRTGSTLGPIVATSKVITIMPIPPKPTYTISTKTNSVVEGATITFDVVTENVGTATLYYNLNGTGITTADFDGGLTGTVSIVDDKGSFTKTVAINAD